MSFSSSGSKQSGEGLFFALGLHNDSSMPPLVDLSERRLVFVHMRQSAGPTASRAYYHGIILSSELKTWRLSPGGTDCPSQTLGIRCEYIW